MTRVAKKRGRACGTAPWNISNECCLLERQHESTLVERLASGAVRELEVLERGRAGTVGADGCAQMLLGELAGGDAVETRAIDGAVLEQDAAESAGEAEGIA